MTDHILQLLQFIAQVGLTGGIAGAIAYWIFRTYSSKWLDNKFAKGLSDYKHAQAKEIEDVKFKIQATFDRLTKLHQKEFEVLPEAWDRRYNSYWETESCLLSRKSYSDLNKMSSSHLAEFLQSTTLYEWEKEELMQADDKTYYYQDHVERHRLSDAREAAVEMHNYLRTKGIFLDQGMRDQFTVIDDLIWTTLDARARIIDKGPSKRLMARVTSFEENGKQLIGELEDRVRRRLRESVDPTSPV